MMMKLHVKVGFEGLNVFTPTTLSNPSPHEQPIETSQLDAHSTLEKNSFALDVCTTTSEKIAQFRRIIIAVVERIQPKENLAARGEVLPQITQEKIPFGCPPAFLRRVIKVEVGRKRGDPIEFLAKVRQWFERADPPNYARNFEKLE